MGGIVRFDNVGLRYGGQPETLADVSFTIEPGDFYFLTGPSGAGKTSLLKMIYLAQRPTRGSVHLFGQDMTDMPRDRMPGFRRRIGVVFQDFGLLDHLTTFDNIALPLRVAGVRDRDLEEPVREMLGWVGLSERADALPPSLSGGEQQRVAIARAVITRPEILVADEPTGNVDPEMAARLLHLFDALNKLGTTLLVATHDLHLLSRVSRAQMMRIDKGAGGRSHRIAALSARWRPAAVLVIGVFRATTADRRLLPEGRIAGPMPWVVGIMMFLTALALAAGATTGGAATRLGSGLAGRLTVQIVAADRDRRESQAGAALAALGGMAGVAWAKRVPDAEMQRLLAPWLGAAGTSGADAADDIPVPALIDVALAPGGREAPVAAALARVAPAARLQSAAGSLAPLASLIRSLALLALGLIVLMAAATAAVVVLAARSALDTHRTTIGTMHLLGATDVQIARLFQRRIALDALAGGVPGALAAVAVILLLGARIAQVGSALLGTASLPTAAWAMIAMLPAAAMLIALLAARLTVIGALRRLL